MGRRAIAPIVPIKYELKLPSEVMPGPLVIQIQIQPMCMYLYLIKCTGASQEISKTKIQSLMHSNATVQWGEMALNRQHLFTCKKQLDEKYLF